MIKAIILISLLLAQQSAQANFVIQKAETAVRQGQYFLNAHISYQLTEEVADALDNSVLITFITNIEVKRKRWYMWDETMTTIKKRQAIRYYQLSQRYVLYDLNEEKEKSFFKMEFVLEELGILKNIPLIDKFFLDPKEEYYVTIQTYLDIEALPPPLRVIAYLSSAWRLTSEIFTCPLIP